MYSNKLKKWIGETLDTEGDFGVEYPTEMSHGDYYTNVAMILAKEQKKNPKVLAEEFVKILDEKKLSEIEKIEVAGPGFINFFLKPDFFSNKVLESVNEKENFGKNKKLSGQKILVEYTDPNPFKEFHIGHLMSNSIGEAISRIIENEGADVKRLSYGGDIGLHVAKTIWAMQKENISDDQIVNSLVGKMYVKGNTSYTENEEAKKEIDDLNKKIFEKTWDDGTKSLYEKGRKVSIEHFQEMFKLLDSNFTKNIWESDVIEDGMDAVKEGLDKNILVQSEGAVVFKGEKYALHTRVFVNSKGVPTYEAKELGLGMKKIKEFSFDKSIVITGNEQNDYFKVLMKVMELLRPEVADKTVHIGHGMLRFTSGKMSSRIGNVITAVSLIDEVKNLISEKMKDREMDKEKIDVIVEQVAIGALRYSILRQTTGKDIIFDFEKSVSFEGDSGPYLQYATVRANSILKKADGIIGIDCKLPSTWQTIDLERMIERFESVVNRAGEEYAPHYIVTYLIQLAGEFNSFYAKHKIIDENDLTSSYKLSLTQSFANVMTIGLNLLGIKVPEEM